jgi:hypothetical protein
MGLCGRKFRFTKTAVRWQQDLPAAPSAQHPAKTFWSLVLYDTQTRSMLQTDQQFPSIGSQKKGVVINPDTSVDIYFAPKSASRHAIQRHWPVKNGKPEVIPETRLESAKPTYGSPCSM